METTSLFYPLATGFHFLKLTPTSTLCVYISQQEGRTKRNSTIMNISKLSMIRGACLIYIFWYLAIPSHPPRDTNTALVHCQSPLLFLCIASNSVNVNAMHSWTWPWRWVAIRQLLWAVPHIPSRKLFLRNHIRKDLYESLYAAHLAKGKWPIY